MRLILQLPGMWCWMRRWLRPPEKLVRSLVFLPLWQRPTKQKRMPQRRPFLRQQGQRRPCVMFAVTAMHCLRAALMSLVPRQACILVTLQEGQSKIAWR